MSFLVNILLNYFPFMIFNVKSTKSSFMKSSIIFILFISLCYSLGNAQKMKFKVTGVKDSTVFLIKYYGQKLYYADTAVLKNGYVEFDGKKQQPGIMGLYLPDQKFFEFIYNNEEIQLETSAPDYTPNLNVKKSAENSIFLPYVKFITDKKTQVGKLSEQKSKLKDSDPTYKSLVDQIDNLNKEVENYQLELIKNNPDKLVAKIVKMSREVEIPETPKNENGEPLDPDFRFKYYRAHYWDNVDLMDDRLVNNPVFHNKMEFYFTKMMIQHWDTVIYYSFDFCDKLNPKSKIFEYVVGWITSTYGKSQIMGMDKVYTYMRNKYYCSKNAEGQSPAYWVAEDKFKDLCEKIDIEMNLVMGVRPPNLILKDSTDNKWCNLYEVAQKSEYTVLYFWDPECGHCKKTTPKLQTLYEKKFRDRNIEIFSVGKAVGKDFEAWKKFIRDNKMTFLNVAVTDKLYEFAKKDPNSLVPVPGDNRPKPTTLESLNYQTTYDIFSTPQVYILDKEGKIIAKRVSISQIEEMLDALQGKKDLPKLFPPDPEEDKQMQQH
jgi:thiol-disulfide isomerase/thioredoxin